MSADKAHKYLQKQRGVVAGAIRALRRARGWTQAELSQRLALSQNRLSELERGGGSFTAEQFLTILALFNVGVSEFVPPPADPQTVLQNALARFGAAHLQESEEVVAEQRLHDVVRDALVSGTPRLVTALAPVLVRNVDELSLPALAIELAPAGLSRRVPWLVENTVEAVRHELVRSPPRDWARRYRRAEVVLGLYQVKPPTEAPDLDLLDPDIRSKQSLDETRAASSEISRRWGIVTALKPSDFVQALRGARAGD